MIFVIRGVAHDPIPPVIDGLRTRVRESSPFRAGFGDTPRPTRLRGAGRGKIAVEACLGFCSHETVAGRRGGSH